MGPIFNACSIHFNNFKHVLYIVLPIELPIEFPSGKTICLTVTLDFRARASEKVQNPQHWHRGRNFCPPIRLPFIILDVEPRSHLVCTGGAGSWMYVMTRERRPAPGMVEALLAKLAATGVDVAKLMPMEHTGTS